MAFIRPLTNEHDISGGLTMTESQKSKSVPAMFADEQVLAWMEEHAMELRQSVSGQRILYSSLVIGFSVGLAAHVGGYALLSSVPSGILGLLADLLHALGWSLWTGVVVAVFVQVIPEAKRRQIKQALDAYDALRHDQAQTGGNREGSILERSHAKSAKHEQGQKQHRNRARKAG
jgi:hypothetical protein